MADAGARPIPPERRLLARASGARTLLAAGIACGFVAAVLVVAAAYLTSVVVADVFLGGATLAAVAPTLAAIAILAVARTPLLVTGDWLTQRAADRRQGAGARRPDRASPRPRPLRTPVASEAGSWRRSWSAGARRSRPTSRSSQPARALAVAVPLLVLGAVAVVDPPTVLVLVLTGPVLVLLLAVIGGRARAITERRFAEMRWLSAFFLDMLQGLATLKLFGRSAEQVDTIRDMSRRYGDTTMEVLRTAFQTSLVLEWGGAVAVALVAVEISLRLMDGAIAFDRALAVLIIVPEFFLPLRTLATRYHAGAAGRTAAERIEAILAEPVRAVAPPTAPCGRRRRCRCDGRGRPDPLRGGHRDLPGTRGRRARRARPHDPGQVGRGPGRADRRRQDDRRQRPAPFPRARLRPRPRR